MVYLPFRITRPILGDSRSLALQQFKSLEQRLSRNPQLQDQCNKFMKDYLICNHMEVVPTVE